MNAGRRRGGSGLDVSRNADGDGWLVSAGSHSVLVGGHHTVMRGGGGGLRSIGGVFVFKALKKLSRRPAPLPTRAALLSKVLHPTSFRSRRATP